MTRANVTGRSLAAVAIAAAAVVPPAAARAQGPDAFPGKPLQIIVGFGAGGGYDLWARTLGRHIGRHLPGRPAVVIQNMPGAGSLNAANHLYTVAPKDGTTIGIVARDAVLNPLTGQSGARFDAPKFSWIGSPAVERNVCIVYHTAPVQSFEDALRRDVVVGATGAGSGAAIYPRALNALLGTRFKLITGFTSSSDSLLAMERGEIDGICESLDSVVGRRPDWITTGKAKVLLQGGTDPDPHLKAPFVLDLARNEEERLTIRLLYAGQGIGRPFLAPPELPPNRLAMLRGAFDATMGDAEFIEDARRQKLTLDPRTGTSLAALVQSIYETPQPIVDKVKALLKPVP